MNENTELVNITDENEASLQIYASDDPTKGIYPSFFDESSDSEDYTELASLGKGVPAFFMALMRGCSVAEAAKAGGFSERKGFYLLSRPDVAKALKEAQARFLANVERRLSFGSDLALNRLMEIVADPTASQATQVRACGLILDHALKRSELQLVMWQGQFLDRLDSMDDY